ncbi:MAG: hypothetical protein JXB25_05600 [Deltaproteobacteria bacterium]|nr:hypothetical protein [Deltaproteobacteria bacterium]
MRLSVLFSTLLATILLLTAPVDARFIPSGNVTAVYPEHHRVTIDRQTCRISSDTLIDSVSRPGVALSIGDLQKGQKVFYELSPKKGLEPELKRITIRDVD